MAFASAIISGMGSQMRLEARSLANITTISFNNAKVRQSNMTPERVLEFNLVLDGTTYSLQLEFADETLESRDILGHLKQRESVVGEEKAGALESAIT